MPLDVDPRLVTEFMLARLRGARTDPIDSDRPVLRGYAPPEFSTCTEMVVHPPICWDVNGYYRSLGVHWRADRAEIRKAYLALDGPNNARLTYVFKQLLNREIRRAYDATPLGELFLDRYVQDWLTEQALLRARQRVAEMGLSMDADLTETLREAFAAMGYDVHLESDTPDQTDVDKDASQDQDGLEPARVAQPGEIFPYGYYLWRSSCTDTERLAQWQEELVRAISSRGLKIKICVGFTRGDEPWVLTTVGYRTVVFLHDDEQPTAEAARAVAARVVRASKYLTQNG